MPVFTHTSQCERVDQLSPRCRVDYPVVDLQIDHQCQMLVMLSDNLMTDHFVLM